MAKRRNLKKEKALRNQAYARKFRKRPSSGRFGKRRYSGSNTAQDTDDSAEDSNNDNNSGAAG